MTIRAFNSSNKIKKSGILFYGKRLYRNNLVSQNEENYLDLWYSKPLYGKVDDGFNVVHPSSEHMKELNTTTLRLGDRTIRTRDSEGKKGLYALNFVADAFGAMSAYLKRLEYEGKINKKVFFHPLTAHKGWRGTNKLYDTHTRAQYSIFADRYLMANQSRLNRQIRSYDDYLPIFKEFLNFTTNQRFPFTKSGFILNRDCPHAVSGLVIEIAEEPDASDDRNKYFSYFRNKQEMSFYIKTAKDFGFYVDMNMPWRLIANLDSPAWRENQTLKEIVDKYFPDGYSVGKVFEQYYHKPYQSDVASLKVFSMEYYNSFIRRRPDFWEPKICGLPNEISRSYRSSGQILAKKVTRRLITMEELERKHDDLFWLRMYMQLRLKEMQIDISRHQIKYELREIEQIYISEGYDAALAYVAHKTAFYLDEQMRKFLSLQEKQENLLTNGSTPDIIL